MGLMKISLETIRTILFFAFLYSPVYANQGKPGPASVELDHQSVREAVSALIRGETGQEIGSGVIVKKEAGGYWIATNRHVVDSQDGHHLCVITHDQRERPAFWNHKHFSQISKDTDLALLWMPVSDSSSPIMTASLLPSKIVVKTFPAIIATGYRAPTLEKDLRRSTYSELGGLLLPLEQQSLAGNYDLTYTALVEKGMSGGGVFILDKLIGINAVHPNPLWPGEWKLKSGQTASREINEKLSHLSLGISSEKILESLALVSTSSIQRSFKNGRASCLGSDRI